ncbi:MAG: hypothetical protein HY238_25985, partial [Acidobacteria bacterium]|nr:hypothetical protein [Acidobacteriota bacterium]
MTETRTVYLYPWDALDEGVPAVLDKLRDLGLTGVKLACVYHTGKLLLAGNSRRRVYVPEDGALYFRPSRQFLRESPLQPLASRLSKESDLPALLCEQADRRHMTVDAWVVCLHNRSIADRHPAARAVNVFGDSYPHALCPMQSQVQTYLHALVEDLCRY